MLLTYLRYLELFFHGELARIAVKASEKGERA